jgi:hypothetical protein
VQARFTVCPPAVTPSAEGTTATKTSGSAGWNTNLLLSRPSPHRDGSMTFKLRHVAGGHTMYGWALPTLAATTTNGYNTSASCVYTSGGTLYGLGTKKISSVPGGSIPVGATLALRYDPLQGTLHVRINDGAEHTCITAGLANNLVPFVCFHNIGDVCTIVAL